MLLIGFDFYLIRSDLFKALRAFRRAKLLEAVFAFLLSCCFAGLHVEEVEKLFQSGSKIEPRGS